MKISVIGSGTFGCALADHLVRNNHKVILYGRENSKTIKLLKLRKLPQQLGARSLDSRINVTTHIDEAVSCSDIILIVVPSPSIREVLNDIKPYYRNQIIVVATKGIEDETNLTMDEVILEVLETDKIAVLSGPTHAEEVIRNMPTGCVIASENIKLATMLQEIFMSDTFRVYTSKDVKGVELGGAIKNIIALAAGISDGLGYGDNAKAALITRGIVEISALGKVLGANPDTFNGLTGLGDLIVTCQSMHSRNRMCGYYIGQGYSVKEATNKVGMVVEGINALHAIYRLAKQYNVDVPIINAIYNVLYGNISIQDIATILINREPKREDN